MVEESVNGLEDSVVAEMTKEVLHEKVCEIIRSRDVYEPASWVRKVLPALGGIVKWYS